MKNVDQNTTSKEFHTTLFNRTLRDDIFPVYVFFHITHSDIHVPDHTSFFRNHSDEHHVVLSYHDALWIVSGDAGVDSSQISR